MLTDEMIEALKEYYLATRSMTRKLAPARFEPAEPAWWDQ